MIYYLDLFGTAVFAVAGALAAGRHRLDLFGVVVVGLVTAVGGGTLRDVILDARPVFWVADLAYLGVGAAAALVTFFWTRLHGLRGGALLVADAFGLAVFTVVGAKKALVLGTSAPVAVTMGLLTGVAGGIARDLLTGEVPLVLRQEIYATASLAGAVLYVCLSGGLAWGPPATVLSMGVTLAVRLAAIRWNLSLPTFLTVEHKASRKERP